jgi:DNA-directed RNA polymerase specialized sigma24 family protein
VDYSREREVAVEHDVIYETFRRAIFGRDADAWAELAVRFRPLMIAWANRARAEMVIDERSEDLADQAFCRAWAALKPEQFAGFPNAATLIAYLRSCVGAMVIDCARAQSSRARAVQKIEVEDVLTPEQIVTTQLEYSELWHLIDCLVETDQDRIILIESFVYDLPPRDILARHMDVFADIVDVYRIKRNLFNRLQRNVELRRMYEQLLIAC